jgi:hypothetical protein
MDTILIIHKNLQVTMMLFMIAIGVWGCGLFASRKAIGGDFWGALVIGEGLIIIQALLGIALYAGGLRPARDVFHILYGIVAVISIPGAFAFTRGRDNRYEALIYGLIGFFLMGISLRAKTTG